MRATLARLERFSGDSIARMKRQPKTPLHNCAHTDAQSDLVTHAGEGKRSLITSKHSMLVRLESETQCSAMADIKRGWRNSYEESYLAFEVGVDPFL